MSVPALNYFYLSHYGHTQQVAKLSQLIFSSAREARVKDQVTAAEQHQDTPENPSRRRIFQAAGAAGLATTLPALTEAAPAKPAAASKGSLDDKLKANIKNVVVIYLENRSFNNLFANFPAPHSRCRLPAALRAARPRWLGAAVAAEDLGRHGAEHAGYRR
jgi:hypothetical protein